MKLNANNGDHVVCHDGNSYDISHRTDDNYIVGVNQAGSQRLFKPDGHYAGSDKAKNVSRIL